MTIYLNYTAETAAAHDESEHNDTFNVDGITVTESAVGALCVETFSLGLASLPGAPKDPEMIAYFDAAFPLVVSSKGPETHPAGKPRPWRWRRRRSGLRISRCATPTVPYRCRCWLKTLCRVPGTHRIHQSL